MNAQLKKSVLTVSTIDHVGVVERVFEFLRKNEANVLQAKAFVIGGIGYIHTLFEANDIQVCEIKGRAVGELKELSPAFMDATENSDVEVDRGVCYEMDVFAKDRKGIVADIAKQWTALGINVRQVEGRTFSNRDNDDRYVGSYELEIPNYSALNQMRRFALDQAMKEHWAIDLRPEGGTRAITAAVAAAVSALNHSKAKDPRVKKTPSSSQREIELDHRPEKSLFPNRISKYF